MDIQIQENAEQPSDFNLLDLDEEVQGSLKNPLQMQCHDRFGLFSYQLAF